MNFENVQNPSTSPPSPCHRHQLGDPQTGSWAVKLYLLLEQTLQHVNERKMRNHVHTVNCNVGLAMMVHWLLFTVSSVHGLSILTQDTLEETLQ